MSDVARTELFIRGTVREDLKDSERLVMKRWLAGWIPSDATRKSIPFHASKRATDMALPGHDDHVAVAASELFGRDLVVHCTVESESNEIALCVEWLQTLLKPGQGFIGYSLFEQHDSPTLYFH